MMMIINYYYILTLTSNGLQCSDTSLSVTKNIWPVKSWVMRCWHGYLSEVRCKWLARGPAEATATPSSVASLNPEWFDLSSTSLLRLSLKKAVKYVTVCLSVCLSVLTLSSIWSQGIITKIIIRLHCIYVSSCNLLLQTEYHGLSVCWSVCHITVLSLAKMAVLIDIFWVVDSGGSKELCIRWGVDPPMGRDNFEGGKGLPIVKCGGNTALFSVLLRVEGWVRPNG